MDRFATKMKARGLSDAAIDAFRSNYDQLITGNDGLVPESSIEGVTTLPSLESVAAPAGPDDLKELLAKTAVVKLNGGLGTSMGLEKAKSLLPVKDGKTFLDLIAEQIVHTRSEFGSNVRFILMNSFSTSADTWSFLREKHPSLAKEEDVELMQNSSCKVDAETLAPVEFPENPDIEWAPPGHGDIYAALVGSGMLDNLLSQGVEYVFVSNSDNLGATLDLSLLSHFAESGYSFMMEVCKRTASDKKGGHLARRKSDGRLILRESAMYADGDKAAFFAKRGEEEQEQKNERLIEMLDGVAIRLPQLAHVCKGIGCFSGPQKIRENVRRDNRVWLIARRPPQTPEQASGRLVHVRECGSVRGHHGLRCTRPMHPGELRRGRRC